MKLMVIPAFLMVLRAAVLWASEAKKSMEVFPSNPFYQYIIYENLVIFWLAIIGLLVIIRMKLREIKRVQKMGLHDRESGFWLRPPDIPDGHD